MDPTINEARAEVGLPALDWLTGLNGNSVVLNPVKALNDTSYYGILSQELRSARSTTSLAYAAHELAGRVLMIASETDRAAATVQVKEAKNALHCASMDQDSVEKRLWRSDTMLYLWDLTGKGPVAKMRGVFIIRKTCES